MEVCDMPLLCCIHHSKAVSPPVGMQGALICLAAATVGLGEPSEGYLRQIVPPVLASFTDQDSRVRYYACEALYNIAKVRTAGRFLACLGKCLCSRG